MVLLILAVLWGVVLIPPLLRNRGASRVDSKRVRALRKVRRRVAAVAPPLPARRPREASRPAGSARPHVAVIARAGTAETPPAAPDPAPAPAPAPLRSTLLRVRRRRLAGLLVAAAATLVLGAVPALHSLWAVHLMLDVTAVGYAVWLRRSQRRHLAAAKVRYLPTALVGASRGDTAEVMVATAAVAPLRRSAAASSS